MQNYFSGRESQFEDPINLGEIQGLSPKMLSYGGYLWAINFEGELFRLSAATRTPEKVAEFPGNGYVFAMTTENDERRGPMLYANNHEAIYSLGLLDNRQDIVAQQLNACDSLTSGIVKFDGSLYFLYRREMNGSSFVVKRVGATNAEYPLNGLTLAQRPVNPVQNVANSLCVLTNEKLLFFNSNLSAVREIPWVPWQIFSSQRGVWYSERQRQGSDLDKQTILRIEPSRQQAEPLNEAVPVTAKLTVDHKDGRLAIMNSDSISLFEFNQHLTPLPRGSIDIINVEATLLTSTFLVWFETQDRSIYIWLIGEQYVLKLFTFADEIVISHLFYANGALFGIAKDSIWRWHLLEA
jgi:hypothetical protein